MTFPVKGQTKQFAVRVYKVFIITAVVRYNNYAVKVDCSNFEGLKSKYKDPLNESYWEVLSCGTVYYAIQDDSNFLVCGWNPKVWPFKCKPLSSTFLWCCLLCYTEAVLTFDSVHKTPTVCPLKKKLLSSSSWDTVSDVSLFCCTKWLGVWAGV